nr:M56 family metallopeptidase [Knoellia sp. DB2414S]
MLLYAVLAGTVFGAWLRRSGIAGRSPRSALALWLSLDASIVLSLALAALAPVVGTKPIADGLVNLLSACVLTLSGAYAGTGDTATHLAVAAIGWAALTTLGVLVALGMIRAARYRRRHLSGLTRAGTFQPSLDAWVLQHGQPLVYCVPGRPGGVVLTTGTLDLLGSRELSAVLAHERAHLRGRHAQITMIADGLRRSVGWIPGVRMAAEEIAQLVEVLADDAARRETDGPAVIRALLALGAGPVPDGALGATTNLTSMRVSRLSGDPSPRPWRAQLAAVVLVASALTAPAVIAVLPAALGINADYCPAQVTMAAEAVTFPSTNASLRSTH